MPGRGMGEVCRNTSILEKRRGSHAANNSPSGRPHGQVSTQGVDVRDSVSRGRCVKRTRPRGRRRGAAARQASRDNVNHRRGHHRSDNSRRCGVRTPHVGGAGRARRGLSIGRRAAIGSTDRRLRTDGTFRGGLGLGRVVTAGHHVMPHRGRHMAGDGDGVSAGGRSRCGSRSRCSGRHSRVFTALLCPERNRRKRWCDQDRKQSPRTREHSPRGHQSPHDQLAKRENAGAVGVTPTPAVTESVLRLAPR